MSRIYFAMATLLVAAFTSDAFAQTPISQYEFNSDVLNASSFIDKNGAPAPDGTFRKGSLAATASFGPSVDGTPNGALLLNGVDDWVDLTTAGHPSESVQAGSFSGPGLVSGTVMAWVKMDTFASGVSRWLMGNSNGSTSDFQAWRFGWDGGKLQVVAHATNIQDEMVISDTSGNTTWADGDWHHIAVAWDGFSSTGGTYVDGVLLTTDVSSGLGASDPQSSWENPMAVGARNNAGELLEHWDGLVDDLRIYAEALTPGQIQTIFNDTPVIVTPDFDSDLDVDGADFLIWQRGFGTGTTFGSGDANGSMTVDGTDLALWQSDYGQPVVSAVAAVQAVPEPTSLGLLLLGVLSFAARAVRQLMIGVRPC